MPIYEYGCEKCGHRFESLIRSARDAPRKCPACGATRLRKQFSTFAVGAAAAGGAAEAACETCPAAGSGCGGGGCCAMDG